MRRRGVEVVEQRRSWAQLAHDWAVNVIAAAAFVAALGFFFGEGDLANAASVILLFAVTTLLWALAWSRRRPKPLAPRRADRR